MQASTRSRKAPMQAKGLVRDGQNSDRQDRWTHNSRSQGIETTTRRADRAVEGSPRCALEAVLRPPGGRLVPPSGWG